MNVDIWKSPKFAFVLAVGAARLPDSKLGKEGMECPHRRQFGPYVGDRLQRPCDRFHAGRAMAHGLIAETVKIVVTN